MLYHKLIFSLCVSVLLLQFTACHKEQVCSEHEFAPVTLNLNYEMGQQVIDNGRSEQTAKASQPSSSKILVNDTDKIGKIRYIIRTFPIGVIYNKVKPTQEFTITKDIQSGYNHEVTLDLAVGNYAIMVWSDFIEDGTEMSCHNADNFGEISLLDGSAGNNIYRDAFRGTAEISVVAESELPMEFDIEMERPLASFEIISEDLADFINSKACEPDFSLRNYKAVIAYVGYTPTAYSLYTDKPVDSATGVMFASDLKQLNENEVSMGFDYVFVNNKSSVATVKVGVFDKSGELVSMSKSIKVPLMRNQQTLQYGSFLTTKDTGGVDVDLEFEGSYDLILK